MAQTSIVYAYNLEVTMNSWIYIYILMIVAVSVFLASLYLSLYRKTTYLRLFVSSFGFYLISFTLLSFQNRSNLIFSSVISNTFLVIGHVYLYRTIQTFFVGKSTWLLRFWLYVLMAFNFSYFTAILTYNVFLRNILVGGLTIVIFIDLLLYVLKQTHNLNRVVSLALILTTTFNLATNTIRPILALFVLNVQNLPIENEILHLFVYSAFSMSSIFWIGTIFLLDNTATQKEILNSEQKFKSLVESTNSATIMLDTIGNILYLNSNAQQLFNTNFNDQQTVNICELVTPEQCQSILRDINTVLATGKPIADRLLVKDKDESRYFDSNLQTVLDEKGQAFAVMFVLTDVTQVIYRNDTIRKFSKAIEHSPVSIVIANQEGLIEYVNPKTTEITGYTYDELMGQTPRIFQSGLTDNAEYEALWTNVTAGKEWSGVFQNKKKNGELYWESIVISPILDEQGEISNFIAVKEDISDRRKLEEDKLLNQQRFEQVAVDSNTVIWELDENGRYTYINNLCERVYGYEVDALLGKAYSILNPTNYKDALKEVSFKKLIQGETIRQYDRPLMRKDGSLIWVSTTASAVFDENHKLKGFVGSDIDITAQKESQDEAFKFKTISDQANYGNAIADLEGNIAYANRAFHHMHGWEDGELIGKSIAVLHTEAQMEEIRVLLKLIQTEGGFLAKEFGRAKKDGTEFISINNAKLIEDIDGTPKYMSVTVIDINENKEKEKELQSLSLAIKQSPVAIVMTDPRGYIEYVSPAFETITGYSAQEVIGKHSRFLGSGQTEAEVYQDLWGTILRGDVWYGELINKKKNGELYNERVSISPVQDDKGRIISFLAVKENITERKIIEEALVKSEYQFRTLFKEVPVAIVVHDKDSGEILDCNPETLRILGLSSLDELQKIFLDENDVTFEFSVDYFDRIKSVELDGPQQFEMQIKKNNGSVLWAKISLTLMADQNYTRVIATATDITLQKQVEEIRISNRVAEEANRAKSKFFSNLSHEIRTPLNAINGFAQILNRDPNLTSKQSEHVKTILRSGEHLIGLINDLLDMSKIEAGQLSLREQEFNFHDLINDLTLMFSLQAKQKRLYLDFEMEDTVPKYIYADEAKLRQIFINLVSNALKFTKTGGVRVRIWTESSQHERYPLYVEVVDTGSGISAADKTQLFNPFWQNREGSRAGGTGLGLPITKSIIEMMRGSLSVESTTGSGSTFKFHVFIKSSTITDVDFKTKDVEIIRLAPDVGTIKILIADDREDNRNVLRELLSPLGFELREANNGEEALQVFKSWQPQAILMDMVMPVMDGYEAIRQVRETDYGKSTLIIGITASVFTDDIIKITEAGADKVLLKPFKAEVLFNLLSEIPEVQYTYKQPITNQELIHDQNKYQQLMSNVPAQILSAMREALKQGNMVQLRNLSTEIESIDEALAKHLVELTNYYEYEKLEELIQSKELNHE